MGRSIKGWWDGRRQRWLVRLGEPSPKTGKPKPVPLVDESGQPIGEHDLAGRDAAIERMRAERDRPRLDAGPTVAQVIKAYLAWHVEQKSAKATIKTHWYHLRRFASFRRGGEYYGDRPAASIVPKDLAAIKKSGIGAVRHLYMSVMACWRWAARAIEDREPERLIPANPLADLIRPRGGQRPSQATPWPVARRILRMARGWARTTPRARRVRTRASRWIRVQALVGIAYSGARTAEMVTLEWDDIHWQDRIAAIPVGRHKGRRTGKMRYVPLLARLVRMLRVIERWPHRHERYVFATRWQQGPNLREWWRLIRLDLKPYLAARGVDLPAGWRPYWLRHSFATAAVRAVGKEKASKALGHSPEVLDAVYDHVEAERVREVADAVERARRRKD